MLQDYTKNGYGKIDMNSFKELIKLSIIKKYEAINQTLINKCWLSQEFFKIKFK